MLGMDFLMEIMEVREELEEAGAEPERLRVLRASNQEAMDELHAKLQGAFDESNDVATAHDLTAAAAVPRANRGGDTSRMPAQ